MTVDASRPRLLGLENRLVQRLGQLATDAAPLGIRPTIEPISYNAVRSVPHAERLARETGCLVLLDALHVARFGGTREEVASVADLVPLVSSATGPRPRPATGTAWSPSPTRASRTGDRRLRPRRTPRGAWIRTSP